MKLDLARSAIQLPEPRKRAGGGQARGWLIAALSGLMLAALLTAGATGAVRYVATFWLYRGFPAPAAPQTVRIRSPDGTSRQVPVVYPSVRTITVTSPALGGYADQVYVALPPGYAHHPRRHYPVLYLLHGFPGQPLQFLNVGQVTTTEGLLVARRLVKPMILVMPTGTRSFLADEEWANGIRKASAWETFVTRDLVRAIQARYRAIPSGSARGIAGLSEGGYAALNIGLHHPGEFTLMESWSGYMTADRMPAIFGRSAGVHAYNSPRLQAFAAAPQLRASHSYLWFYTGVADRLARQNRAFSTELSMLGIGHRYFQAPGRHNWALWRALMPRALMAASGHLRHG